MVKLADFRTPLGITLGLLVGLPQGLSLSMRNVFETVSPWETIAAVIFGLVGPVFIATRNAVARQRDSMLDKINSALSLYAFLVSMCASISLGGLWALAAANLQDGRTSVCYFFLAAAIGFLVASNFDPRFGRRRGL